MPLARVPGAVWRLTHAHGPKGRAARAAGPLQGGHPGMIAQKGQGDDLEHRVPDAGELIKAPELIVALALEGAHRGLGQQTVARLRGAHQVHAAHVVLGGLQKAQPVGQQPLVAGAASDALQIGQLGAHQVRDAQTLCHEQVFCRRTCADAHQIAVGHPGVVDAWVRILSASVADEAGAVAVSRVRVAAHVQDQWRAALGVDTLGDRVVHRAAQGQALTRSDARRGQPAGGVHSVITAVGQINKAPAGVSKAAKHGEAICEAGQVSKAPLGVPKDRARHPVDGLVGGVQRTVGEGLRGERPKGGAAPGVPGARVEGAQVEAVGRPEEDRPLGRVGRALRQRAGRAAQRRDADQGAAQALEESASMKAHGAS